MAWFYSLTGLTCAALGSTLGCGGAADIPDVVSLQSAYDRQDQAGSVKHDKGLKIVQAECNAQPDATFACTIGFTSASDQDQALYMDIATVARSAEGWELKSGLCRN